MKPFMLVIVTMWLISCNHTRMVQTNASTNQSTTHLLGVHPIADLRQAPFADWFLPNYQNYQPDSLVPARNKEIS